MKFILPFLLFFKITVFAQSSETLKNVRAKQLQVQNQEEYLDFERMKR